MASKSIYLTTFLVSLFLSNWSRSTVYAADYFISANGVGTGSCTSIATCTFSRAQNLSSSGDTIQIVGTITPIIITKPGLTIRGGKIDAISLNSPNSAGILIEADNTTLEDLEITNGWSYGFRTKNGIANITARRLNLHHNVRENFLSSGGCNPNVNNGWGSAMRAYFADGMSFSDSNIWENCGEGFSAVMSKNILGNNLNMWDNWSVNAYPDQTESYSLTNSSIYCLDPLFQRFSHNRSILLGAEGGYGTSTTLTKNITISNNNIYNCKGVDSYKQTTGDFSGITITNNNFYNIDGATIGTITGTNIITSPNSTSILANIPYPLASLIPSPFPSPSPSLKPGDLNADGHVNLFDFNLLVSKFGNPYTIFDFNAIVSNYGK